MNEMVAFINLFFVPMLPVYAYYKRTGRPLKLTLEIFMEYCIMTVFLVPATKIILFLPSKILHTQIHIYSGYYTIAALLAATIFIFFIKLQKVSIIWCWLEKLGIKGNQLKFLLNHQVEPDWSRGRKAAYYAYRMFLVIFTAVLMSILLLDLAAGDMVGLKDYLPSWKLIALNTAPVILLAILLYGITGRAWSGLLLGGGLATVLSLANYYKLSFRNDPLRLEDLLLFREAANMASGGYTPFIDERIVLTVLGLAGLTVFLYFTAPGKLSQWKKRGVVMVAAVAVLVMLTPVYRSQTVYESVRNKQANIYNPIENFVYRGFVYPFLYSVNDMIEAPLPGYDEKKAQELLSAYEDKAIPEGQKINVIAIMREAYTDFSRYGISGLDAGAHDAYHALEEESYVGNMVSNTFGGGTINAERSFLTGNYQDLRNYRSNFNSYVWYLRQQGYTTEGSHPYFEWFYSRNAINGLLGFENYRFYENDFENLCPYFYCPDSILYSEIYDDFQRNKSTGRPYFSFSVTMQAHGPYPTDSPAPEEYLTGPYSEQCRNAMSWYLHTSEESDRELIKLVDQLRFDPEPVALILFGDHMPWMGDGNAFYNEMGLSIQCEQEGSMYSTRYLIWVNDAARELLGHDVQGEGPTVSPCYLMNLLFRQLDWEGPAFLQAMDDMMEVFPVLHTLSPGHYVVDGVFTKEVPDERKELFSDFCYLQKYWRSKYLFENVADGNQPALSPATRHTMPRRMSFILHAGGVTSEGTTGSNSLEALNYSYEQGYRDIEMDFCWTGDRDLACVHDWGSYYGSEVGEGTIEQFDEIRGSRYGFTSMTLDHLARWLEEHPGVQIITDIKEDNVEGAALIAQRYPGLIDRFVIQIYHYDEYEPVALLGFKNIILTVYQMAWEEKTNKTGLEEFIKTHRLMGLTFPEVLLDYPIYGDMTFVDDVPLYVHTVNDGELQKKYLDMGISGLYTDVGKAF